MNSAGQGYPGDPFGYPTSTLPAPYQSGRLKPCPFCGQNVTIGTNGGTPALYRIVHPNTGCIIPEFGPAYFRNSSSLVMLWNRRARE